MGNSLNVPIIKPMNCLCNLDCEYCYMKGLEEPYRSDFRQMNQKTLISTIDFFCSHQDEIEFVWHGGEPLLAGMDFYDIAIERQNKWKSRGKKIVNFLQTNGTLIDETWANFLADAKFGVGVSFDAPADTQDILRKTRTGMASSEKVLNGITLLKEKNIFNGVSCCVSQKNVDRPDEIIEFFLSHDIKSLKFLRIKSDKRCKLSRDKSISAEQHANFLIKVFKIWLKLDNPQLEIRDIKSVVDIMMGGNFRECVYMGRCNQFSTVFNDGSIFPCDCLLANPSTHFGNVSQTYQQVTKSPNFSRFLQTSHDLKDSCNDCKWYFLCRGGCLNNISDRQEVCAANRKLFEKIEKTLAEYGFSVNISHLSV